MPEPIDTDPILFDRIDGEWSHRYAPASDDYWRYGKTVCCGRPIYVPTEVYRSAVPVEPPPPLVADCCDTPGIPKPVELPPYTGEHATCRKCGSKAVETRHKGPGVVAYFPGAQSMTESMLAPPGYPKEWLERRCVVCRAEWDEATIGAQTPHDAAAWSVWGIGDTWWVHHSPSGMFLPIDRGLVHMLTPMQLVEAGARLLGNGGAANG